MFPSVLQPLTEGECVPGFRVKSFPSALRELVSQREQYGLWSDGQARIVDKWETLGESILFFRQLARRQRAEGTEW